MICRFRCYRQPIDKLHVHYHTNDIKDYSYWGLTWG